MTATATGEILQVEIADAWLEYLEACRGDSVLSELRYQEVEPWAWARLQQTLRRLRARARRTRP